MSQFPKDPQRIRERIRRYERELANEKKRFKSIHDGAGKRYLLGPLYLLLGDVAGARKSFTWFARTFPDDIGEPFQYLCWTLALYRSDDRQNAARKLAQTWFKNPYLVSRLLGIEQQKLDCWHSSNWEQPEYVEAGPSELLGLWDEDELAWAKEVYDKDWFKQVRATYLEMQRRLANEPVGPERSRLVRELYRVMALEEVETGQ